MSGERFNRIAEGKALLFNREADYVAVGTTAEAVIETLVVVDIETRRLLIMERTAPLCLAPGPDKLHLAAYDRRHGNPSTYFIKKGRGNHV